MWGPEKSERRGKIVCQKNKPRVQFIFPTPPSRGVFSKKKCRNKFTEDNLIKEAAAPSCFVSFVSTSAHSSYIDGISFSQ